MTRATQAAAADATDELALFRSVTDADLRGRDDCYIVEGPRIVERFLVAARAATAIQPIAILLGDECAATPEGQRIQQLAGELACEASGGGRPPVPVHIRPEQEMIDIAGYRLHHGALALGRRMPIPSLHELLMSPPRTVVCLERVVHTDNVGSIFRTVGSLGDIGILLSADSSDPLLRKCIRVSSGRVFCTPWARSRSTSAWLGELAALREAGYRLIGAERDPRSVTPASLGLGARPGSSSSSSSSGSSSGASRATEHTDRVAFVIGAEGDGVAPATLDACDDIVEIPMRSAGGDLADNDHPSLNAAVATAMLLAYR